MASSTEQIRNKRNRIYLNINGMQQISQTRGETKARLSLTPRNPHENYRPRRNNCRTWTSFPWIKKASKTSTKSRPIRPEAVQDRRSSQPWTQI